MPVVRLTPDEASHLLAEGEDLRNKSRRANRTDLHNNVFNYLMRRWKCRRCGSPKAP